MGNFFVYRELNSVSSVKEMIPRINHAILDLAVSNLIVTDFLFDVVKNLLKQLLDRLMSQFLFAN